MTFEESIQMQANMQKMFEPYQGLAAGIQRMIEPLQSISIQDTSAIMNSMQQIASLSSAVESMCQPTGITKMLERLENIANITAVNLEFQDYSKQFDALSESLSKVYEPIKINEASIRAAMGITASIPSYRELTAGFANIANNLSSIATAIYEESEGEEISELETDFSSNEELQEAIIEQNENPIGFQERVANWAESKKKKYYIAILVLMFVWNNFIQPYFQEYIGVPVTARTVACVREFPEKASKLITDIKEDIEATIIENVPYYYKITFIDENGEEKEGYVSKRSVKFVAPVVETEDVEEQETAGE